MAEGASLSCLESMACGVVPIVTPVGGLTDLVFDRFNGLIVKADDTWDLVKSKPEYLVEGIEYLYHNRDKLAEMKNNAISIVKTFSKQRWEEDVSKVVKKVFGDPNE
jgi:glycosyltransferase involved in cell wall biosynthesis